MAKGTCSTRGCFKEVHCRDLCKPCYGIAWRQGKIPPRQLVLGIHSLSNVDTDAKLADCAVCGDRVPIEVRVREGRERSACATRARERRRAAKKGRRRTDAPLTPAARRRKKLRAKYGITPKDYERMFTEQQGLCAICGTGHPKLFVDHDHATGVVRGLLCHFCNIALGWLKDNASAAEQAARYLRAHQAAAA